MNDLVLAYFDHPDGHRTAVNGPVSIGRSSKNEVVVADEKVSRRHAIVHAQESGQIWLVDLGSSNGTYVNARRIQRPQELQPGDRIRVGNTELVFQRPGSEVRPDGGGTQFESATDRTVMDLRAGRCWLLLADIAASSVLSRTLQQEEMPALVGQWFSESRDLVESAGGLINKYLGDGFFAYWPVTKDHEPIHHLCAELLSLQARSRVEFRWVLHHGLIHMGGMPTMGEESLSGPEVNFIFRVEKLAGSLGCPASFSKAAVEKLGERIKCRSLGKHSLAGFEGEHEIFAIASPSTPG